MPKQFLPPLLAAAVLCASAARAAEPAPPMAFSAERVLTLERAVEMAANTNAALSAARNQAQASEGLITQAGLLPNPSIEVAVDGHEKASRTTTAMLTMPVETGGKRSARQEAAQWTNTVARHDLDAAGATLRASVTAAFFEVALAQEAVRVSRETQDIAMGALRIASKRVEAGKAAPIERGRAEIEVANARVALRAAEMRLQAARRALSVFWGETQPFFEHVQANLDGLPARQSLDALRNALKASPHMRAGQASVELSRAELKVEKSKRYPDLTVGVGVARDNELGRNKAQFVVSMPLPLFDRNQGNVYAASMQSYKAQDIYRDLETRLTAELLDAASRYDLALATASEYRASILPQSGMAYEFARKGFEAGKTGYLEVLDAQRVLSQGNVSYLTALADAYQARAQIDRLTGR